MPLSPTFSHPAPIWKCIQCHDWTRSPSSHGEAKMKGLALLCGSQGWGRLDSLCLAEWETEFKHHTGNLWFSQLSLFGCWSFVFSRCPKWVPLASEGGKYVSFRRGQPSERTVISSEFIKRCLFFCYLQTATLSLKMKTASSPSRKWLEPTIPQNRGPTSGDEEARATGSAVSLRRAVNNLRSSLQPADQSQSAPQGGKVDLSSSHSPTSQT